MKVDINCWTADNKIYLDKTTHLDCYDLRQDIVRQVIDTQEQAVRESLIKLGWTPPKKGQFDLDLLFKNILCTLAYEGYTDDLRVEMVQRIIEVAQQKALQDGRISSIFKPD
jgi:hypothetical protein